MMKKIFAHIGIILFILMGLLLVACDSNEIDPGDLKEVSINLKDESIEIEVGDTKKIDFEIINAIATFNYEIDDESIIRIEDGVITALKAGNTNVNVTVVCNDEAKTTREFTISVEVKQAMCTITYQSNVEGFKKDSEEIAKGETKTLNETPKLDGYDFVGWTLTKDGDNISEIVVDKDLTIYANFVGKEYNVIYELDGGSYDGQDKFRYGEKIKLGEANKEGYYFVGWSLDKNSTSYINELIVKRDITIYAIYDSISQYQEGVYPIKYDLDGGSWLAIYASPSEIATEFMADFYASSGHKIEPAKLDCAYIESSWFGDMMKNKTYLNKWMWLLDAIWEVASGSSSQKASNADFGSGDVKGFYLGNLNGFFTSTEHKDTYLGPISANYADPSISRAVYEKGTPKSMEVGPSTYTKGVGIKNIPTPILSEYNFIRWVDKDGNTVTSISNTQTGIVVLKAIWEHEIMPEEITFSNLPEEGIKLYESLQLKWTISPNDAVNKKVLFYSLNEQVLSINEDGLIKAKSNGTAKIRIRLAGNSEYERIIELKVWSGEYFDVSYKTNSYVEIGKTIDLFAEYVEKDQTRNEVTWSSLNKSLATVDSSGRVTGVSEGLATIRATYNNDLYFDFYVTVIDNNISDVVKFVLDNHNSNAQTTYNLGIGDGTPEYYYDVVGSVNNLLFDTLKYDYRYYDKLPSGTKNYGEMSSVEFITIHYTGNMKYGADADNNCSYFNNLEYRASIHYVTGRTNLTDLTGQSSGFNADAYYAFAGLNEKYGGWHATNGDPAIWDDTGLVVQDGDPLTPVISISKNMKYTINGRETKITIPTAPTGYSVNGNVLTVDGKQYSVFNQYGLLSKVENGKYYLAKTHWGTQRTPRALCTCGGNRNSIGIESCVDIGSDLEHTWHVTAQLVANLLVKYNLGFDRVVGHHFFSGKNCPQPFLENDMELWYQFMDMVKAEYELLTTYKGAKISAKAVNNAGILRNNGLLVQDKNAQCVTYEVSITQNGVTKKITLATCVESFYKCDCQRSVESLQIQGYPII